MIWELQQDPILDVISVTASLKGTDVGARDLVEEEQELQIVTGL